MMATIYALATARGRAGVAVIRVSGPDARAGLLPMVGSFGPARMAALRRLMIAGEVVDQALVLWFPANASFTGEEVVELQIHGSPAIERAVLGHLATISGFRLAEAGEFTRRALENGRLDLAQVEGLADLIVAETEAQRRQAMRIFAGELGRQAEGWRQDLVAAAALLAVALDFADEDVPPDVLPEVAIRIGRVRDSLTGEIAGFAAAERIRDGFEVAIIGAPNTGKSTLLNRLAGREAALTSEHAGTTRDIIEVRMDIGGLPVTFLDTAGMRKTSEPVEKKGIIRATERANRADLRIFLQGGEGDYMPVPRQPDDLVVAGKADLAPADGGVSGLTGVGVGDLLTRVGAVLAGRTQGSSLIAHQRQREIIMAIAARLDAFAAAMQGQAEGEELLAARLQEVLLLLGSLTGRTGVEDVLDVVFSSFCIGK